MTSELTLSDAMRIGTLDAHDQAALVRRKELPAAALISAAVLRIESIDKSTQSVSHFAPERAIEQLGKLPPSAEMFGVPWLAKDSLDVRGMPTTSCSRSKSRQAVADCQEYVDRLTAGGLVAIGKSAMPEFGLLASTEPLIGPITRNPWSLEHSPGGSSGGAAAAVAAGLVPIAHGSDGGGSIRIPASCCGVVGLKPGWGSTVRVRARHFVEDILVGDSLIARSVRDVAWGFSTTRRGARRIIVSGPAARRLRVGVVLQGLNGRAPDSDVAEAIRAASELCSSLGHEVGAIDWPVDGTAVISAFKDLWSYLGAECVDSARVFHGADKLSHVLEPWTLSLADRAGRIQPRELERIYHQMGSLPEQMRGLFTRYDVILSPVTSRPAPKLGTFGPSVEPEQLMETMFDWISYTPLHNLAGIPAISLPIAATSSGLPIGVMFAADRDEEHRLLSLGYELEAAAPWSSRWPACSAAKFELA